MKELIESIKKHEGFVDHVYKDHLGYDTIGFGTKMPLTMEECEMLLVHRLEKMIDQIVFYEPNFHYLPESKQDIILEMCYQMGVKGVIKFKNMWKALKDGDYEMASVEMLDSLWAKQTPERAKELAIRMAM